jgi:hypothetical protein
MTVSLPPVIVVKDDNELLPPIIKIDNQTFKVNS